MKKYKAIIGKHSIFTDTRHEVTFDAYSTSDALVKAKAEFVDYEDQVFFIWEITETLVYDWTA
jgi:hypothetical protein